MERLPLHRRRRFLAQSLGVETSMRRGALAVLLSVGVVAGYGARARADIPAGYLGKPHKGTPLPIPGRINPVDYDEGGKGVGFDVDHAGDSPCNGFDYRT